MQNLLVVFLHPAQIDARWMQQMLECIHSLAYRIPRSHIEKCIQPENEFFLSWTEQQDILCDWVCYTATIFDWASKQDTYIKCVFCVTNVEMSIDNYGSTDFPLALPRTCDVNAFSQSRNNLYTLFLSIYLVIYSCKNTLQNIFRFLSSYINTVIWIKIANMKFEKDTICKIWFGFQTNDNNVCELLFGIGIEIL